MRETEVSVKFQPSGRTVHVLKGTRLQEAAAGAGIVLDLPCGGEGVCGKCRVLVTDGIGPPGPVEQEVLSAEELSAGHRLACQSTVLGPTIVEIPRTSLLAASQNILVQSEGALPATVDPAIRKKHVQLARPSRGDDAADLERLQSAVGPFQLDLQLLRDMPELLRKTDFQGTAVLVDGQLIDFEPGNTESEAFAVAVDVGTTTLAAVLLDLNTGRELAVVSRTNPQIRFGDDVLSRIRYAREGSDNLGELTEAIVAAVDEMIGRLAESAGIARQRIYEVTCSGNTTMQQLFCGVDPSSLGEVPFIPAAGRGLWLSAAELGLRAHRRARAFILPVIGGFVGGDTISGILATDLVGTEGPTLLVDIGTNGEIVLSTDGQLLAASTAAGPAFEGARISQGMRGTNGAIEKVLVVDGRLRVNVIGDVPPVGLCGSALIDTAAELLRHRLLSPRGRLQAAGGLPDDVPPDLAERIVSHDGQIAFQLVPAEETGSGKPIVLTQADLRELQLATGAIRAGIACLLRRAGLEPSQLGGVLIAGGFGNFIRRSNAQRIGLLPSRIERRRIRYRGNTSLAGAQIVALSRSTRQTADELARRAEHIDLSTDPEFSTTFADAMIFPGENG